MVAQPSFVRRAFVERPGYFQSWLFPILSNHCSKSTVAVWARGGPAGRNMMPLQGGEDGMLVALPEPLRGVRIRVQRDEMGSGKGNNHFPIPFYLVVPWSRQKF